MKVTKEKVENSQAYLTVEMEPAEVEESLEKSYQRLVKRVSIPGFRKGKAPRTIVERYIGKESLLEESLKRLLPEAYEKAIAEEKLEAVAQPQIEVVQREPLVFKATVPLAPTVKLGDYHQLRLTPEPVDLKDEDVNAIIERLRHQHAVWEPVERPVEFNDMVGIDLESSIEGKPFINQKGVQYQVIKDSPAPVKGFPEQLVGMKRGEEKEFQLQIPVDYPRTELAGKEASFKAKINEIKKENLPELNDDFAKQVDPEYKSLSELRERLAEQLKARMEESARIEFEDKVVDEATKLSQVEYPPVLVEAEVDHILEQQARRLQSGGVGLDEYLKSIKKTADELRDELRPMATKRVTRSLVLDKIAEQEKIEVGDSEIDAEITASSRENEAQEYLNNPAARESFRRLLLVRKTLEKLAEIAKAPKEENQEKEGQS